MKYGCRPPDVALGALSMDVLECVLSSAIILA